MATEDFNSRKMNHVLRATTILVRLTYEYPDLMHPLNISQIDVHTKVIPNNNHTNNKYIVNQFVDRHPRVSKPQQGA